MTVAQLIKELEKYDEILDVTDAEGFLTFGVVLETTSEGENFVKIL